MMNKKSQIGYGEVFSGPIAIGIFILVWGFIGILEYNGHIWSGIIMPMVNSANISYLSIGISLLPFLAILIHLIFTIIIFKNSGYGQ